MTEQPTPFRETAAKAAPANDTTNDTSGPAAPLSERQEAFCQAYVCSANAAQAAREAGYAEGSARQSGHRLLCMPQIAARIEAIRETLALQGCRTQASLLGKLENVYARAIYLGQYAAAARVVEIQARIAGLLPGRGAGRHVISENPEKTSENRDSQENHR